MELWGRYDTMREILRIDLQNYQEAWPIHKRSASKAIFCIDNKLVMLQSNSGDLKFVGGGIEEGESEIDCLIREVKEETGYDVIQNSIKEIGIVVERRKDKYDDAIWEMLTYLYSCEVNPYERQELNLTQNEIYHGMKCVFVTGDEAICINEKALEKHRFPDWLHRDLELLKLLFNKQ
jgi:8-oxo-dGTP pyrophosphatase MutT (NUDIX family)